MEDIYKGIYVGGDEDYSIVRYNKNWSVLRCTKYGADGHRDLLGYDTLAAPPGKNQYFYKKNDRLAAINLLDLEERDAEQYIPTDAIIEGLRFVKAAAYKYPKVLIACQAGRSRGPTIAMLYLRAIGDMKHNFSQSHKVFRGIYTKYNPGLAMYLYSKQMWDQFKDILNEDDRNNETKGQ